MRHTEALAAIDWNGVDQSLMEQSFASLGPLLTPQECLELIALYSEPHRFRSRIEMEKYRFGRGEYQYFRYPLPHIVEELRHALYRELAKIANRWSTLLASGEFPCCLDRLLALCHQQGQTKPTPLMLRYETGDYNCLHQDIYGAVAFPMQVVVSLSEPERDYSGGEFLLLEQRPRAQSTGRAVRPRQGEALVIATRHRPAQGKRGVYRVNVRHGVSPVTAGRRWTLGILFHDAN